MKRIIWPWFSLAAPFFGLIWFLLNPTSPKADLTCTIPDSLKTLDPSQITYNYEIYVAMGLWEGLSTYDPKTTSPIEGVSCLPPQISTDGRTYLFTLRSDAKWSNGDPVTAQDFLYGWRHAIEPGSAGEYSFLITDTIEGAKDYVEWRNEAVRALGLLRDLGEDKTISTTDWNFLKQLELLPKEPLSANWKDIADRFRINHQNQMTGQFESVGIRALDEHHLQVTLIRPLAYFLDLMSFVTFTPLHRKSLEHLRLVEDPAAQELTLWLYDTQWVKPDCRKNGYPGLISNGPYRMKEWKFKRHIILEKNPYYWDRNNVQNEMIQIQLTASPTTAFLVYERGGVDWMDSLTRLDFAPSLVELMQNGFRNDIYQCPAYGVYFFGFNCSSQFSDGSPNPFSDARVRLAFSLAVDKESLVKNVRKIGEPAWNFIPPNTISGYSCPAGPTYNPMKARRLLADAGFPNGEGLPTIEILFNTGGGHESTAEAVAQMWETALQVHTLLRGKELKSFEEDRKTLNFMICRSSWFGDYMDPTTFLDMLTSENGNNKFQFSNAEYDNMIRQASQTTNVFDRMNLLNQAESLLLHQEAPILPLFYYVNLLAYRENVKGVYPNARDLHPLKWIYVNR